MSEPALPQAPVQDPRVVVRYSYAVRVTHWAVALAWCLLFASGLSLFHPYFFWISEMFGGGNFMRVLHPFLGVALALLFFGYAAGIWRDNLLSADDRIWLRRALDVMNKRIELGSQGKYNAGQKLVFWMMLISITVLLATGVVFWRPYFAASFSADARQLAVVAHVLFAFITFVVIGIHVYAAYWTKGSIHAMTRGYVSKTWALQHHPGWYRLEAERADRAAPERRA
jgi:formate dehydrogenase subunit gamma